MCSNSISYMFLHRMFVFGWVLYDWGITFLTAVSVLLLQAGQVYGVPLADSLLTKPGIFPEQKPCGEDLRKKWIEVCFLGFSNKC